jgi:hypothetical protein
MWAWYDYKNGYWHIYPKRFMVEMCSPDGFKKDEELGKGKIVEVEVSHKLSTPDTAR